MTSPNLVFIDTETTSLNRRTRQAWEIGYILRNGTTGEEIETSFFVNVDLREADPASLRIGRYFDRHPNAVLGWNAQAPGDVYAPDLAAKVVEEHTRGAVLVGAVPSFDEETLANLLYAHGLCPSWHYHLVDVETLAAGALGMRPPWNFDKLLAEFDLTYDEADRHTALGDAWMALRLYDAVWEWAGQAGRAEVPA